MIPICRHEGVCGGCGLQPLPYAEQLAGKAAEFLARLPPVVRRQASPAFVPVFPTEAHPWHFRQKVAFVFGEDPDGGLTMGHYARGSQRLVPVAECPVHSARGNRMAFTLRDHLRRAGIGAAGASPRGVVRHLLIRTTQDDREAVAMLVVTANDKRLRKPVRSFLASAERPEGFFVNIHAGADPYMVGRETLKLDGHSHVRERLNGISYLISPDAFFQTNVRAAAALQALVVEWATERASGQLQVLDLYAGSGLFTLPLVAAGHRVVAVEENRQAVRDADANLRLNRLSGSQLRFLNSRVEAALERVSREHWDVVILDPPRQGCSAGVIDGVFGRIAPDRVIYVSCNPEALASELPVMLSRGYRVDDLRLVDMFPHTGHLESVVRLVRDNPRRKHRVGPGDGAVHVERS